MFDISRFRTRLLIFSLLLALPILRMLLYHEYGMFHIEVLMVVIMAIAVAAALAAVTRTALVFHIVTVATIIVMSVNALQTDFFPDARARWLIAGLFFSVAAGIYVLRQNFYKILAVFLAGSFLVDVAKAVFARSAPLAGAAQATATARKHNHVVHIVLDEMLGLAAMPAECSDCQLARAGLEETFRSGNFRTYPYAFSNYRGTQDSIPSILNDRLLHRTGEYFRGHGGRSFLRENAYFDRYTAKNYDVRIYQSDYLLYSAPKYSSAVAHTYMTNSLKALHSTNLAWPSRFRQIMTVYARSDQFLWGVWSRIMPARFQFEQVPVMSLAVSEVWPSRILTDIRNATKDTLFFVHLLLPHYPYAYKPDGSVRAAEEFPSHSKLLFYDTERAEYWKRYGLYGQQVQFLNRQIAEFIDGLRATGHYDPATIIFHGDHGSRLRLVKASEREAREKLAQATPDCAAVSRYDYPTEPDERDLLNRFATLLAIKLPGAAAPEVVNGKGSVLYFLRRNFSSSADRLAEAGINSAYLFDANGRPKEIPLAQLWQTDH